MSRPAPSDLDVFYPIVPDADWLERLVPLGIRTVQLRLKDARSRDVERQIVRGLAVCERCGCQLIVNDHWREAISAGAGYVHLGQEDLAAADLEAIRSAQLRLGISTHSTDELDVALGVRPDYVALGPIWETRLKAMKWTPQGLARITQWKGLVGAIPLVAIGGITPDRADAVIDAGARSVAVITDFMTHPEPEARIQTWLEWAAEGRRAVAERQL